MNPDILTALKNTGTPSFVTTALETLANENERIGRERYSAEREREERASLRQTVAGVILAGLARERKDVAAERTKAEQALEREFQQRSPILKMRETETTTEFATRVNVRNGETIDGLQELAIAQIKIGIIAQHNDPKAIADMGVEGLRGRHVEAARLTAEAARLRLDTLQRAEFKSNRVDRPAATAMQHLTDAVSAWTRQTASASPTVQRDAIRRRAEAREADVLHSVARAVRAAGLDTDVIALEPTFKRTLNQLAADVERGDQAGQIVDAAPGMVATQ